MSPRIGSLFSGYGGLDMAVQAVLGGEVAWHCEIDRNATRVLAHHWPGIPNLGDVASVRWADATPIDVLVGGFPCQTVSQAGKRGGLAPDQSGFLFARPSNWSCMAAAIDRLRPGLVVIENVRGLLHAGASAVDGQRVGSAFGIVLGDLANLGFDARWTCVPASAAGAPHRRERVFVVATNPDNDRCEGQSQDHRPHVGVGVKHGDDADGCGVVDWAGYGPAVRHWERELGRRAPSPVVMVKGAKRLSPLFVEWMMGLPAGHVTAVPGLSRNEQLKMLGNGVVPQQAAGALRHLLPLLSEPGQVAA